MNEAQKKIEIKSIRDIFGRKPVPNIEQKAWNFVCNTGVMGFGLSIAGLLYMADVVPLIFFLSMIQWWQRGLIILCLLSKSLTTTVAQS